MKSVIKSCVLKSINLLVFSALFLYALTAQANMAAPSQGGTLSGEPNGLEKIFIRRENLTIDFRPMDAPDGQKKNVNVEAVYEIENTAADQSVKLVFVLDSSEIGSFNFYLDDRKIPSQINEYASLPAAWKAPLNTPWQNDRELDFYPSERLQKTASIDLLIPKGAHVLKAEYKAAPASYYGYAPQLLHQFAYILAPARDWAGFGGLDLTVHLPEGWEMMSNPKLESKGNLIRAHFDRLPADAFAFTIAKPLPAGYHRLNDVLSWVVALCFFLPAGLLIWLFVRQYKKGHVQPAWGFLLGLLWAILFGAAAFASAFTADYFYPTIKYGYGDIFYFLIIPMACATIFVSAGLIWLVCALIFNKRRAAEGTPKI